MYRASNFTLTVFVSLFQNIFLYILLFLFLTCLLFLFLFHLFLLLFGFKGQIGHHFCKIWFRRLISNVSQLVKSSRDQYFLVFHFGLSHIIYSLRSYLELNFCLNVSVLLFLLQGLLNNLLQIAILLNGLFNYRILAFFFSFVNSIALNEKLGIDVIYEWMFKAHETAAGQPLLYLKLFH